jgi:hypothetical protein
MRMAEPSPLGETSFRAIVRAIVNADPANVRGGGCVESVFTLLTQRRVERGFDIPGLRLRRSALLASTLATGVLADH